MQRLLALLAIPAFLVSACSGETRCPTGTEKISGKCMLPGPAGEWTHELPLAPDAATAEVIPDTAEVIPDTAESMDLQEVADVINAHATETVEIEQTN